MRVVNVSASCLAAIVVSTAGMASDKAHWSYEGDSGPEHWVELDPANAACAGNQQSPIDLTTPYEADIEDIEVRWSSFAPEVVNNAHTIQANAAPGQTTLFGEAEYELLQVHWHNESEHTIDGQHAPVEAHFVHQHPETGELLVLGVMMVSGETSDTLKAMWDVAPAEEGEAKVDAELDWNRLLPDARSAYRYAGSLTTPPCTEVVNWVVFSEPIEIGAEQIERFTSLFSGNNRPIQSHERRLLLVGS